MSHWCDHSAGASPLGYVAMLRRRIRPAPPGTPERDRVEALRIAAEHGRLDVIDRLLAAGTPVDGVDHDGSTALHEAACSGRADTVSHLVAAGADPGRRDTRFAGTPLGRCRHRRAEVGPGLGHGEVEAVLAPITPGEA